MKVKLGYEIGSGKEVLIQTNMNLAATGQTRRTGKCLSGDDRIVCTDGRWLSVKDAHEMTLEGKSLPDVISLDSHYKLVHDKISAVAFNGIKKVFRVVFSDGRNVKLTGNHPIFTARGWVPIEDLNEGHRAGLPRLPVGVHQEKDGAMEKSGFTDDPARSGLLAHGRTRDKQDLMDLAASDLVWRRIETIEYVGEEPTYDVQVEANHNLVVNDVLVHNTTAIEAVITRGKATCLTFRTKEGETGFIKGRLIRPFYRERADWVYVKDLTEATLNHRLPSMLDSFFMRATDNGQCKTIEEVREHIELLLKGDKERKIRAATGMIESVFIGLRGYLDLVLPELASKQWATELDIKEGEINVMDLIGLSEPVQALIVAACIEEVHRKFRNIIIVVPEASDFFPRDKGSPAKLVAQRVAKKGGAVNRFLWIDTQAIFDVDAIIRSQDRCWLLGPQTYTHEVERTLELVPLPKHLKPKADEVQTLPLGHFFLAVPEFKTAKLVYAQPWWLPDEIAKKVALGEVPVYVDEEPNPEIAKYKPEEPEGWRIEGPLPPQGKPVKPGFIMPDEDWSEVAKAWKEAEALVS
ncbi:MAG: hypothetical protein JRN45_00720 [Nitrososphaerota archaeon]|nr:hypothetical protein [Nitrososphaerota archaeon]